MIIGIFLLDKGLLPRLHTLVDPYLCGEVSRVSLKLLKPPVQGQPLDNLYFFKNRSDAMFKLMKSRLLLQSASFILCSEFNQPVPSENDIVVYRPSQIYRIFAKWSFVVLLFLHWLL